MRTPPEVRDLLVQSRRVLVICHINPDGDAIGSLLGLGWALQKAGKTCVLSCADPVPEKLLFLPGAKVIAPHRPGQEDLIITLDASDLERLGAIYDPVAFADKPLLVMDHHITNRRFGTVNWIEKTASTAELCYALITDLGIPLDPDIATCLLTGVVTDTRNFRTSNTTPDVLRTAISLIETGGSLPYISEQVYQRNNLSRIALWGQVLSRYQLRDRVIWAEISQELLQACHATWEDADDLVSFLGSTREADVSVLFEETEPGRVDVSMRAVRGVDVSGVALRLGGGGHPQAAGCTCQGALPEVRERVLAAIWEALREQVQVSSR